MKEDYGLRRILDEYNILLMDSSTIGIFRDFSRNRTQTRGEKENMMKKERNYLEYLIDLVNNGHNICLTELVKNENSANDFMIKKVNIRKEKNAIPEKRIKSLFRTKMKTISSFIVNNKIINLNDKEIKKYNEINQIYKKLVDDFGLSKTDLDILIEGNVLAQSVGSCALLTNDTGIYKAWNFLIKNEDLSDKQFGIFLSLDQYRFMKPAYYTKLTGGTKKNNYEFRDIKQERIQ